MKIMKMKRNAGKAFAGVMAGVLVAGSVLGGNTLKAEASSLDNVKSIFGEAAEYGIVAETLNQIAHMQTNFAVADYINAGQYTGDDITGGPGNIVTGNECSIPLNSGAKDTGIYQGVTPSGSTDVSGYVSGMIWAAAGNLSGAASSNSIELPELADQNNYTIDITGCGNIAYVNLDSVYSSIAIGGLKFVMNDDQTVVVTLTSDSVDMGRYSVNGSDSRNCADKVIWNLPNATTLTIGSSIGGAIVAPNANVYIYGTSHGWLIAKYVQNDGAEWHKVSPSQSSGSGNSAAAAEKAAAEKAAAEKAAAEKAAAEKAAAEKAAAEKAAAEKAAAEKAAEKAAAEKKAAEKAAAEKAAAEKKAAEKAAAEKAAAEKAAAEKAAAEKAAAEKAAAEKAAAEKAAAQKAAAEKAAASKAAAEKAAAEKAAAEKAAAEKAAASKAAAEKAAASKSAADKAAAEKAAAEQAAAQKLLAEKAAAEKAAAEKAAAEKTAAEKAAADKAAAQKAAADKAAAQQAAEKAAAESKAAADKAAAEKAAAEQEAAQKAAESAVIEANDTDDSAEAGDASDAGAVNENENAADGENGGAADAAAAVAVEAPKPVVSTSSAVAENSLKVSKAQASDKAVLGASRRPQTGDSAIFWNIGFIVSVIALTAWLLRKRIKY